MKCSATVCAIFIKLKNFMPHNKEPITYVNSITVLWNQSYFHKICMYPYRYIYGKNHLYRLHDKHAYVIFSVDPDMFFIFSI